MYRYPCYHSTSAKDFFGSSKFRQDWNHVNCKVVLGTISTRVTGWQTEGRLSKLLSMLFMPESYHFSIYPIGVGTADSVPWWLGLPRPATTHLPGLRLGTRLWIVRIEYQQFRHESNMNWLTFWISPIHAADNHSDVYSELNLTLRITSVTGFASLKSWNILRI